MEDNRLHCPFNKNIECSVNPECISCGWNPAVHAARVKAVQEKFKSKPTTIRIG